jgi:DNA-binding LacI/PurR family transcriptional regulator
LDRSIAVGYGEPVTSADARRPTLADVAARAGVSRSLASLVIRNDPGPSTASRQAVLQAVGQLGYHPDQAAKLLREQRSRLLGVVIDPGDPFHADLLEQIYPAAEERGYDVVLSARVASRPPDRAVEALLRSRCEALILLGTDEVPTGLSQLGRRTPVVLVGRRGSGPGVDAVVGADEKGADLAAEYLIELGHRGILFIDGGRHAGSRERRRGYRRAMRRHALDPAVVPGDHTEQSGIRAARDLLATAGSAPAGRITAVLASNDRTAVGFLDTLLRAGVAVAKEMSVVGYDDSRLARLASIDLTTVAQDVPELAGQAVTVAIGRIDQDPGAEARPRTILLEPRLVVRGTTAPPAPDRGGPEGEIGRAPDQ